MSNIILTTKCQRQCKYCFAKDNDKNHMQFDMDNFKKVIDWLLLDTDFVMRAGFLGGEPTIHPLFIDFLDYTLSKYIKIIVFSNGMVNNPEFYKKVINVAKENQVKYIEDLGFCVNVNEEKYRSEEEIRLQDMFFTNLGRVCKLSFNIFEEQADMFFLIDMIKKYNLSTDIRLGLAEPLGNKNVYLKPEYYSKIGTKIVEFGKAATKEDIAIGFDCGFVRCMFTDTQFKELDDINITSFIFDCGPTIDIYPNLEVSSCYPLSNKLRVHMDDFPSYKKLHDHWTKELKKYRYIYEDCNMCDHLKRGECVGGCKAHNVNG